MRRPPRSTLFPDTTHFRALLELSEHDPVEDYDALAGVLAPLRAAGLRLAIDDVGAGFSSLRHVVLTAPDVVKLDRKRTRLNSSHANISYDVFCLKNKSRFT